MADIGYVESELGNLPPEYKRGIVAAFRYVLNNFAFSPTDRGRATNFQLYYKSGTTSPTVNGEFSIAHGLNSAPSVLFQVLPLSEVGTQMVPLQVSRAADDRRVYLRSSSTSAAITVAVG